MASRQFENLRKTGRLGQKEMGPVTAGPHFYVGVLVGERQTLVKVGGGKTLGVEAPVVIAGDHLRKSFNHDVKVGVSVGSICVQGSSVDKALGIFLGYGHFGATRGTIPGSWYRHRPHQ